MVVDSKVSPAASLLTFVEGSNWTVDYYSQVIDADNEVGAQNIDRAAPYQQYWLIERFEMKVTTALNQSVSQDEESKSMNVTGAATTYPHFIPNKGDMFIADIGDGNVGVFTVTASNKKTYLKESVYEIEYVLTAYLDNARLTDFARKTVKTTVFVKDFLAYGQDPMVISEDFNALVQLKTDYGNLLGMYLRDFFSVDYQTLMIPGQSVTSYDPFLTRAFCQVVSADDNPLVARIRQPAIAGDQAMNCKTFWDALVNLDGFILPTVDQQFLLLPTVHFKSLPQYSGIYYTGIMQVLYPQDQRTDVDASYHPGLVRPGPGNSVTFAGRRYHDLQRVLPPTMLRGFQYAPPIPNVLPEVVPVTQDPYYVFTAGFYGMDGAKPASQLELMTLDAINGKAIDNIALSKLAERSAQWENLERFYYVPVILTLLQAALRRN